MNKIIANSGLQLNSTNKIKGTYFFNLVSLTSLWMKSQIRFFKKCTFKSMNVACNHIVQYLHRIRHVLILNIKYYTEINRLWILSVPKYFCKCVYISVCRWKNQTWRTKISNQNFFHSINSVQIFKNLNLNSNQIFYVIKAIYFSLAHLQRQYQQQRLILPVIH